MYTQINLYQSKIKFHSLIKLCAIWIMSKDVEGRKNK